jgi:thiol-disulfide isomerase/thioredoxin
MKLIYCVMIMLCPCIGIGQANPLKPIAAGENFPAVLNVQVANYTASEISLAASQDQLVLLDFMTTGCTSCIAAFPHLDSLQAEFGNRLRIILVTPEKKAQVASFLKRKNIAGLRFPVVWGDTLLQQLFPHTYIPHDVLIKNGKVIAVTYPEYIVALNIKGILEGKYFQLPVKRDITNFSYSEPLLHPNENTIPDFSYPADVTYSTVTSYMDDIPEKFTSVQDTVRGIRRISMINVPIVDLYVRALYGYGLRPAFIKLPELLKDHLAYDVTTEFTREWRVENTFCYEGSFPIHTDITAIRKKMGADLDFYFGFHSEMENERIMCWVISRDSTIPSTPAIKETEAANDGKPGITVEGLVYALNATYGTTPVIDESGYSKLFLHDLLPDEHTNIESVKNKLAEYGLLVTYQSRLTGALVITANNPNYFNK